MKDIYANKTGYLYECDDIESAGNPTNINYAYVCEQPVKVDRLTIIPDVYEKLLEYESNGQLIIKRYDTLSEKQKEKSYIMARCEIIKYSLIGKTKDSYENFIKSRFPNVWKSVENEIVK